MNINEQRVGGFLGADAIGRQVGERTCISFTIAVTKKVIVKSIPTEKTEWFDVEFWPLSNEQKNFLLTNLKKGTAAIAIGERRTETYTDKDLVVRKSIKLIAEKVTPLGKLQLLKGVNDSESSTPSEPASTPSTPSTPASAPVKAAPTPALPPVIPPVQSLPAVPLDLTIAPGNYRAEIHTPSGTVEMNAMLDVLKPYIASGQARLTAMGPPVLLPAAPLPQPQANIANNEYSRPPLPDAEMVEMSGGFDPEEAPFK